MPTLLKMRVKSVSVLALTLLLFSIAYIAAVNVLESTYSELEKILAATRALIVKINESLVFSLDGVDFGSEPSLNESLAGLEGVEAVYPVYSIQVNKSLRLLCAPAILYRYNLLDLPVIEGRLPLSPGEAAATDPRLVPKGVKLTGIILRLDREKGELVVAVCNVPAKPTWLIVLASEPDVVEKLSRELTRRFNATVVVVGVSPKAGVEALKLKLFVLQVIRMGFAVSIAAVPTATAVQASRAEKPLLNLYFQSGITPRNLGLHIVLAYVLAAAPAIALCIAVSVPMLCMLLGIGNSVAALTHIWILLVKKD